MMQRKLLFFSSDRFVSSLFNDSPLGAGRVHLREENEKKKKKIENPMSRLLLSKRKMSKNKAITHSSKLTFLRMVGGNVSNSSLVMAGNEVVDPDGDCASAPLPEPCEAWLRT